MDNSLRASKMESSPIFASHMSATASPSPQTGETTTGDPSWIVDSSSMCSRSHAPFGSPVSIDLSPSWQGGSGTMSLPSISSRWAGDGIPSLWSYSGESPMESSRPEDNHSVIIYDKPFITRRFTTDVSSFKALVQRFTGMHSSSTLPRSSTIPDVLSDKTTNSDVNNESTHDQKGFAVAAILPLHEREIKESASDMQEIIGRVDDKHGEIIGRVDDKHAEIIGRAADKHKIMELILSHGPNNNRFTIVCITGADGLGKTTLASLVYCDETMCRSFETRAWLCLSEVCGYEELLRSVVASLTGVSCVLIEQDDLKEVLKEELMGKKFERPCGGVPMFVMSN